MKTNHVDLEKWTGSDAWLQEIFAVCGKNTGCFFGEKYDRLELSKFFCTFEEGGVWEGMTENSQAHAISSISCAVCFISCQREHFQESYFSFYDSMIPVAKYQ